MPFRLSVQELLLILVIITLLFGVGRIARLGQEAGQGIKAFRAALRKPDSKDD